MTCTSWDISDRYEVYMSQQSLEQKHNSLTVEVVVMLLWRRSKSKEGKFKSERVYEKEWKISAKPNTRNGKREKGENVSALL